MLRLHPATVFSLAGLAGVAGILLSPYPVSGDDVAHYQIAHSAPRRPDLLLSIWGRPGYTLLHVLPAQIGFTACRILSLALALAGAAFAAAYCSDRGRRVAALATGFTFFQACSFELALGALTETVFAAFLAAGFWLLKRGREVAAALAFSWTAVTRLEGMPMLLLFAASALATGWTAPGAPRASWSRRSILVFLLALFPLLWNLLLFADSGFAEPLALWTLNPHMSAPDAAYGRGSWVDYFLRAPLIHGPVVFGLLIFGVRPAIRAGSSIVPLFLGAFYIVQTILWAGGLFASAGYLRFVASAAPAAGILAAYGVERLETGIPARWTWFRSPRAASVLLGLCALWALGHTAVVRWVHDEYFCAQDALAGAILAGGGVAFDRPVISDSAWVLHRLGLDPRDVPLVLPFTREAIESAPAGTWIAYAGGPPLETDAVSLDIFFADADSPPILDRRRKNRHYAHLLKNVREGFQLVSDQSVLTRLTGDPEAEPWPYHALLFRKTARRP